MYNKLTDKLLDRLEKEFGKDTVFSSEDALEPYSTDQTMGIKGFPDAVVKVKSAQEVRRVLLFASENKIPITPRGLGYGLSGGAIPIFGGIVISTEKMDRVLEIDQDNLMAVIEPGIITGNFHRVVEEQKLFYPPDPASLDSCSLGGNIAEGAGGPHAVKYGTTKDYVCGLEVVLPNGEIINTGGKIVKNTTGYNLTQFYVGSEGTLGIITKAILRLIPLPPERTDLLVVYSSVDDASKSVAELIRNRVVPSCIELMDNESINLGIEFLKREPPFPDAAAHLIITLQGNEKKDLTREIDTIGEICSKNGAKEILLSHGTTNQQRLWEFRRCMYEAGNARSLLSRSLDPVVPRMKIPEFVHEINNLKKSFGFNAACFGHAGDGNIHVIMFPGKFSEKEWTIKYPEICRAVYQKAIDLGGKIAAEHGIGAIRKSYLKMAIEPSQLELLKHIKRAFDPQNIMNPGKVFDL